MKFDFSATAILLALTTSACSASNTAGLQCELRDGAPLSLHISIDMDKGLFTARRGEAPVITGKPAEVDRSSSSDPAQWLYRLKIDMGPTRTFLVVFPGGNVSLRSWSNVTGFDAGHCTVDQFKGL